MCFQDKWLSLQYRKERNSNNTSALDNTVKSIDMLTMIQSEFRCTNFNSVDEAYKLLISRLEEAGCYVATSKQDINEYTFADEYNPAVEGETLKVNCEINDGDEVIVCEFRIREYYTDPGSVDYAYVIDVYEDGYFRFSSLR